MASPESEPSRFVCPVIVGVSFECVFPVSKSHDEKTKNLRRSAFDPGAAVRRAGGGSPRSGGMDDPSIPTPRHVRAVDFAAARAPEVRARTPATRRRFPNPPPPPPTKIARAAYEDQQTHPAKPRSNTMATSVTAG